MKSQTHVRSPNTAEIMMAYAVMIKSTLIGMELSENQKDEAKALFDQIYTKVLVDRLAEASSFSDSIH